MSVFTELSQQDIETLLSQYTLGHYRGHSGIQAGTENTNYFVDTDLAQFVLTVFEKHSAGELPFFLSLGEHLHDHQCAVPQPFRTAAGDFLTAVQGKPAVLFERVAGKHQRPSAQHAATLARALAHIHRSTADFNEHRTHSHNHAWITQTARQLMPELAETEAETLARALTVMEAVPGDLPRGIIHADLFHDNALFVGDELSGIIDWYFAGEDAYALDIAVCLIDWCLDEQGFPAIDACADFALAYHQVRPVSAEEIHALPALLVQAATRFWLSRALAAAQHSHSDSIQVKDPEPMRLIASYCMHNHAELGEAFKCKLS
ncbi:MAG: homoserine kinase [Saccharospirillum sp.]